MNLVVVILHCFSHVELKKKKGTCGTSRVVYYFQSAMELDKRCVILRAKCDRLTMVQLLALTRQRGNICLAILSSLILST